MAYNSCGKFIAIIGGLIVIINAIFSLLGVIGIAFSFYLPYKGGFGLLSGLIGAILGLILGIVILIAAGAIRSRKGNTNAILVIILGIVALLFVSGLGGIITILGGIIMFC